MKKLFIIFILLIFSVFLLFFVSKNSYDKNQNQLVYNQNRVIKDTLLLEQKIALDNKYAFMKLYGDKLYFISWAEVNQGKIFSYDILNKTFSQSYDFNEKSDKQLIINEYLLQGDTVVYHDKLNFDIVKRNLKETLPKRFHYPDMTRLGYVKNNYLIYGWADDFKAFFKKLDFSNGIVTDVKIEDEYLSHYEYSGVVLDGEFSSNTHGLVLVPYGMNRVYKFDKNLSFVGSFDLIYDKLDFKFRKDRQGNLYPDSNNLLPNESSFLSSDDKLHIITNEKHFDVWKKHCSSYVDIYDLKTDSYLKSYLLNCEGSKPLYLCLYNEKLVVLFEDSLNIYTIKSL